MSAWTLADFQNEIAAATDLMAARPGQAALQAGLLQALQAKLVGMTLTASDLVALYKCLPKSDLPDSMKQELTAMVDQKALGGTHTSGKIQPHPQALTWMTNYLTSKEVAKLELCSMWEGAHVLAERCKLLGVKSVNEQTKKSLTALLVCFEMKKGAARPAYECIYKLSQHVQQCILSCQVEIPAGAVSLQAYPSSPQSLSAAHLSASYASDKATQVHFPDLPVIAQHHTPVRSTSSLLRGATLQKKPAADRSESAPTSSSTQAFFDPMVLQDVIANFWQCSRQMLQPDSYNLQMLPAAKARAQQQLADAAPGDALDTRRPSFSAGSASSVSPDRSTLPTGEPAATTASPSTASPARADNAAPDKYMSAEGSASIDDFENEAFNQLKQKRKLPAKAKGKCKPQKKAKASPKAKATAKAEAKAKAKATSKPATSNAGDLYGCCRCRGNANGCSSCLSDGFQGIRLPGRQAWQNWMNSNKKK